MTGLNEQEVSREIADNELFPENLLHIPIEHFAYPYGARREREAAPAGRVDFETAATTRMGCLSRNIKTTSSLCRAAKATEPECG